MKYLLIPMLFIVSLCGAEKLLCTTDNGNSTYGYYCNNDRQILKDHKVGNCSQISEKLTIPMNIMHVKFNKCEIKFVLKTVELVKNLNSIDLSYSEYVTLNTTTTTTTKLNHLKKFNASHNEFMKIPRNIFETIKNVWEIDFSYNKLRTIESDDFDGATKLTHINLSHNNITQIHEDAFVNLTYLEYIDFSDNNIQTLEMLNNNRKLKTLIAINNPLSYDCHNFSRLDTLSLRISWQNVESFNTNCKSMQFKAIVNGTREGIVHKSKGNFEIHCAKESMSQIAYFMAGRNKVENVNDFITCFGSTIQKMVLSNNFVGIVDNQMFERFTNLELLYLRETKLVEFDFDVLKNQQKLNKFDISDNGLKDLRNISTLANFDLMEFKASGNQFTNTQDIIKQLKSSIKVLDVSDNIMGHIQSTTFERFTSLFMLKLSNTNLSTIDSDAFGNVSNLTILDLSHNNLKQINFTSFSSALRKLHRFYAVNCQIENASDIIQHFGQSLVELDLSGNDLAGEFNINTFKALTNLNSLHLNNTNLGHFNFSYLESNTNLKILKLCDNKLQDVNFNLLPKKLLRLDLDGNFLHELLNFNRSNYPQLEYLGISNNWLSCNYLMMFKKLWNGLKFIGDPLKQKHHEDCRRIDQSTVTVESIIIIVILTIIIVLGVVVVVIALIYLYYKRKRNRNWNDEALKRIRKKMQNSELYGNCVIPTFGNCDNNEEQMYEEISLSNDDGYDHLRYETDPMPLTDTNDHYHNVNMNSTRYSLNNRQSRCLASRI